MSKVTIKNKKLKNRISSKKLQHEVAKSHKKEINDDNYNAKYFLENNNKNSYNCH